MTSITMVMGILVLVIGVIGLVGVIYVYSQLQTPLNQLAGVELGINTISGSLGLLIPQINTVLEPISGTINTIRTSITMFIYYNIIINFAVIFTGIGLISIGRSGKYHEEKI